MANFTKSDLVRTVAETTGTGRAEVEAIITAALSVIREETNAGQTVNITGFGRFAMKDSPERPGRNPRTGEAITIAAKRTLSFKPSKSST